MMSNCGKYVTKIIACSVTSLVLLSGGVQAQSEPGTELPARQGSSYQPGAGYPLPASGNANSPRDRSVERTRQMEQNLRRMMASFGVTDLDIQNAIIVHVQEDVLRRQKLRDQNRRLQRALRDETISLNEMSGMLTDFRALVEADQAQRVAAEAALNAQIGYSTNPRLEAMLLLFGIIGDGSIVAYTAPNPPRSTPRSSTPKSPDGVAPNLENNQVQSVRGNVDDSSGEQDMSFSEAQRLALLEKFDFNRDGELDADERNEARDFLAREMLRQGLWPQPVRQNDVANRNIPAGNSEDNGSTPGAPPARQQPALAPTIPAQTVSAPSETPTN